MTTKQIYDLVELKVNDARCEFLALADSPNSDYDAFCSAYLVYEELSNLLSDIRAEIIKDRYRNLSKIQKLVAYNLDSFDGIPSTPALISTRARVAKLILNGNNMTIDNILHYHDDWGFSYHIMDGILFPTA